MASAAALSLTTPSPAGAGEGRGEGGDRLADERFALLRDHVRNTFAYNRTSLSGHLVGALVLEFVYWNVAPATLRYGWGAAFALLWLARAMLAVRFARDEPDDTPGLLFRLRAWQVGVVAAGAMWGAAAWLFWGHGGALHQIVLVVVVYTFCVACIPILASQFKLYVVFVLLVFVPVIVRVASQDTALDWEIAIVLAVAMAMTMVLGRNYKDGFGAAIRLKLKNEALTAQLRSEKQAADAARSVAEIASRSKTQFFAAASHDLRQPLHAMGLFAEALRQRVREPEVAQLVNSINESVGALEGLFSQLLDITRIDSGGVDVKPAHFELSELFRKLKLHCEPAAFEKGLELRFRGGRRSVYADPLLVERILRNLVANAIRYTEDGSVLVACRRRGERIVLQVWDTGPGIRDEDRARVFEEFYQVPGSAPVQAEQTKGLGLGLAIVKRLAGLMNAPVTLRSMPGRGSVFSLELPPGEAQRSAARTVHAATAAAAKAAPTLAGRTIVIVDDEPAVRDGLDVLLREWGARTVVLDSLAALADWSASLPADAPSPSLVIADYRLQNGDTGLVAIRAVRRRFAAARVPAIVVSGSTTSGLETEAVADDFHLLTKPVLPNKLRAMIAFKLSGQ